MDIIDDIMRFYSVCNGRFNSRDPQNYNDNINIYCYANDNQCIHKYYFGLCSNDARKVGSYTRYKKTGVIVGQALTRDEHKELCTNGEREYKIINDTIASYGILYRCDKCKDAELCE